MVLAWLMAASCLLVGSEAHLTGPETWAYRPGLPAPVNPAVRSPLALVLSLRGDWEFITQPTVAPLRHPRWRAFYAQPWPGARTIGVPGCWEAQGVGEPGPSVTWDPKWDHGPRPLRHVYMGEAWYRKRVSLPADWANHRVWLKVGGVRSQGWFWVNERPVAWVDNYCGSYKYDITDLVKPGEPVVVVAAVNNAVPSRKGQVASSHRFGGLYRDVELEATPLLRIDDAWVRGDFDQRRAEIHAAIAFDALNAAPRDARLTVRVTPWSATQPEPAADMPLQAEAAVRFERGSTRTTVELPVPLSPLAAWSPEHPNLYLADLTLWSGNQPIHGWRERFGVRKIEVRGDRFFLNNQPFFVRGFGDDYVYPLTMSSPQSRAEHLKHLQQARQAGFNYVRLHTHCETPEYFEAADEAGIMIQAELPYYGDYPTEAFEFDPLRDLQELCQHYRRYVSLTTYCTGNEGLLGKPLDAEIYRLAKRLDPDRLMLHQDGELNDASNSDFRNGPIDVWAPGSFIADAPWVAHEYLNLSVKQDPRLEPRFSGPWLPPVSLAKRDEWLAEAGLDRRWGDACQDAQHALQAVYQKRGLEAARLDPACDGYDFWTIVDVVVAYNRTYSAQGLLNPFWEPKQRGATPADFARFNGPTALLLQAEPAQPTVQAGDTVQLAFSISHFGEQTIAADRLRWQLKGDAATLAQGEAPTVAIEPGTVGPVATCTMTVPDVDKPQRAVLEVTLGGASNAWDYWLFPQRARRDGSTIAADPALRPALEPLFAGLVDATSAAATTAALVIGRPHSPTVDAALARGQTCLLIAGDKGEPNVKLGWWAMGNQVGTAFASHRALGDFPHDGTLTPLSFRLVKQGLVLPLPGLQPDDMFVVGEGADNYYVYACQARLGAGKAVLAFGLDVLSGQPEANCLLDALINYAQSPQCTPRSTVAYRDETHNGWARTVAAGDHGLGQPPGGALLAGQSSLDVARGLAGHNELTWETQPVPPNADQDPTFQLTWLGGMGYFAEPPAQFTLWVNDQISIYIPEISANDAEWRSLDGQASLRYVRDASTLEYGLFVLTIPSATVTPGQPVRLKVVGSDSQSRRWMGVFAVD